MKPTTRRRFIRSGYFLSLAGYLLPVLKSVLWSRKINDTTYNMAIKVNTEPYKSSPSKSSLFEPSYLALHRSGELKKRGEELWEMIQDV